VGSEVFPNENYLTSVLQPAVRQEQSVGSVGHCTTLVAGGVCGQARFFTRNAA
jgi:hypothetical protein